MPTLRSLTRLVLRSAGGFSPDSAQTRRDRRRSAIVALSVGAATYLALHLVLAGSVEITYLLSDPVFADKERSLTRIERDLPPGSPLVLFLGTSRTGNGFDAAHAEAIISSSMEKQVGAFNFGTPASGPVTHLLHLRRLLHMGHRPGLVLLEIHAPTLAELPDGPLEARFADGSLLNWSELDWLAGYRFPIEKLGEKRQTVMLAPWYGLRFQLVGRLSPSMLPFHLRYNWGRETAENGWNPVFVQSVDDEQYAFGLARAKREYLSILSNMTVGEAPVRAVRDLLALCHEHSIPVVLVRMPEASGFRAFYPMAVETRIEACLSELATRFGCTIANCREWMSDRAFADGHHLLRSGATEFSARLAREVIEPRLLTAEGTK